MLSLGVATRKPNIAQPRPNAACHEARSRARPSARRERSTRTAPVAPQDSRKKAAGAGGSGRRGPSEETQARAHSPAMVAHLSLLGWISIELDVAASSIVTRVHEKEADHAQQGCPQTNVSQDICSRCWWVTQSEPKFVEDSFPPLRPRRLHNVPLVWFQYGSMIP